MTTFNLVTTQLSLFCASVDCRASIIQGGGGGGGNYSSIPYMGQRTVFKVDISCHKCKTKLLKAVAGLQGVDKIEVDEAKGTLTVTGDADPFEIIVRTKKAGKFADVVSIGPSPPPPKPQDGPKKPEEDKKPEQKKPDQMAQPQIQPLSLPQAQPYFHNPHSCPVCEGIALVHAGRWDDPNPSCSIL